MPDEQTSELTALRSRALSSQLIVPAIWPAEITNVLGLAHRTGRLTSIDLSIAIDVLKQLDFRVESSWDTDHIVSTWAAMQQTKLSAYDASYLRLAIERQLPLATLDKKLASAARDAGIATLP